MQPLGLNEIRKRFLDFFKRHDHLVLPSFSLIPKDDPSILLINAGMTPMKKWFTGEEVPPKRRVATCQKCIRTPDIDHVGMTDRHGTFFEMLGNFSFNDYFKKEAITLAYELLTVDLEIEPELIHATVYLDDDEAYNIWHDVVGLPKEKITRLGKEDNFWEHGVGPCGPCSEIFIDRGEGYGCGAKDCGVACVNDCDRFVEIWNLVFTQFKRQEDGTYEPLSSKNIDTGGGLERFAMVMQDVKNLFEVDTVRAILDAVCDTAGVGYHEDPATDVSLRVITDHIRSATFMIADGVRPGNEGRGYVLRRLIRRAATRGYLLNIKHDFLCSIAEVAMAQSKDAYPELEKEKERILRILGDEERAFKETVESSFDKLEELMEEAAKAKQELLSGEALFKLHDTYGLPIDLSKELAESKGFKVDLEGFEAAMQEQKERARMHQLEKNASAWEAKALPDSFHDLSKTVFLGYEGTRGEGKLLGIFKETDEGFTTPEHVEEGEEVLLVFDETPFYAEGGGQIYDTGTLVSNGQVVAEITDCQNRDGRYLHRAKILSPVMQNAHYLLQVDKKRRDSVRRNHTATHLLHAALRAVLGEHVEQRGSLVHPDYLRFDFAHPKALSHEELRAVEDLVNEKILENDQVETELMDLETAKASGAMSLFGEKYASKVRVLRISDFSLELCGGTHLANTSEAGLFRITSENGIAAGIRRMVALTGEKAYELQRAEKEREYELAALLKTQEVNIYQKVQDLLAQRKDLERALKEAKTMQRVDVAGELLSGVLKKDGLNFLLAEVEKVEAKDLRELSDRLMQRGKLDVLVLFSAFEGKVLLLAKASKQAVDAGFNAGAMIKTAAQAVGGNGGGKAEMAQAGGKEPEKIKEALELLKKALSL